MAEMAEYFIRPRYEDKIDFSADPFKQQIMKVRATDTERTIDSAWA